MPYAMRMEVCKGGVQGGREAYRPARTQGARSRNWGGLCRLRGRMPGPSSSEYHITGGAGAQGEGWREMGEGEGTSTAATPKVLEARHIIPATRQI